MKYTRLTKEQFEELHQEFAKFLATQSIDAKAWEQFKKDKPQLAEEELDIFSDLVWEDALSRIEYVENRSNNQLFLFHFAEKEIDLLLLKILNNDINANTTEGIAYIDKNLQSDKVQLFTSNKAYSEDANMDKFKLIQQGSLVTEGELFRHFKKRLS